MLEFFIHKLVIGRYQTKNILDYLVIRTILSLTIMHQRFRQQQSLQLESRLYKLRMHQILQSAGEHLIFVPTFTILRHDCEKASFFGAFYLITPDGRNFHFLKVMMLFRFLGNWWDDWQMLILDFSTFVVGWRTSAFCVQLLEAIGWDRYQLLQSFKKGKPLMRTSLLVFLSLPGVVEHMLPNKTTSESYPAHYQHPILQVLQHLKNTNLARLTLIMLILPIKPYLHRRKGKHRLLELEAPISKINKLRLQNEVHEFGNQLKRL